MILPNLPQSEDFSAEALAATEYNERIKTALQQTPAFRPLKSTQTSKPLLVMSWSNAPLVEIDRYSDKYLSKTAQSDQKRERLSSIVTNLAFFPEELHSVYEPAAVSKTSTAVKKSVSIKETLTHLDEIAMKEEEGKETGEKADGAEEDDDEDADEAVYEEDEFEDETDYNASYFDNGEDYGDYDDGNDEAVFWIINRTMVFILKGCLFLAYLRYF